jgi:hypothetical protein
LVSGILQLDRHGSRLSLADEGGRPDAANPQEWSGIDEGVRHLNLRDGLGLSAQIVPDAEPEIESADRGCCKREALGFDALWASDRRPGEFLPGVDEADSFAAFGYDATQRHGCAHAHGGLRGADGDHRIRPGQDQGIAGLEREPLARVGVRDREGRDQRHGAGDRGGPVGQKKPNGALSPGQQEVARPEIAQ